jgi:hypothetical protein
MASLSKTASSPRGDSSGTIWNPGVSRRNQDSTCSGPSARCQAIAITALQDELDQPADPAVDFTDIRQRLARVLAGLRHQRARESDLIYEAYYDAVRSDIDEETDRPPPGRTP